MGFQRSEPMLSKTLPSGVGQGLIDALRGEPAGAARSAMILVGLIVTGLGYAIGRLGCGRMATRWLARGS